MFLLVEASPVLEQHLYIVRELVRDADPLPPRHVRYCRVVDVSLILEGNPDL